MIFKRNVYGYEEIVEANVGNPQLKYKMNVIGCRQGTYTVNFENGVPYIKRYGKKLFLEAFTTSETSGKNLTLGAYLQKKKNLKNSTTYSFLDFQQFIYMDTICSETIAKEIVFMAKNLIAKEAQATEKTGINVAKVMGEELRKVDPYANVVNGFNAKRIR